MHHCTRVIMRHVRPGSCGLGFDTLLNEWQEPDSVLGCLRVCRSCPETPLAQFSSTTLSLPSGLGCVPAELWSSVSRHLHVSLGEGCHPIRCPIVATSHPAAVVVNKHPAPLVLLLVLPGTERRTTLKCFPLQREPSRHYSQSWS